MLKNKIDLVVMYVDETDDLWFADYIKYKEKEIEEKIQNAEGEQSFDSCRTRGWRTFRYFFRGVEKNCPWVNKIFLIVQRESQLPKWLDRNNPKLRIVYHDEFIPKEFLPTFNNFVIETFLYRIEDLSDSFIIGCDDFFFINSIPEDLFFDKYGRANQECSNEEFKYYTGSDSWVKMTNNSLKFLSQFNNKIMNPYKHFFESRNKAWERDWFIPRYGQTIIDSLKISKFRHDNNILPTVFADTMRLLNITNHKKIYSGFSYIRMNSSVNLNDYKNCKMICINDTKAVDNFETCEAKSIRFLNSILPNKSSFEIDEGKDLLEIIKKLNEKEYKIQKLNNVKKEKLISDGLPSLDEVLFW